MTMKIESASCPAESPEEHLYKEHDKIEPSLYEELVEALQQAIDLEAARGCKYRRYAHGRRARKAPHLAHALIEDGPGETPPKLRKRKGTKGHKALPWPRVSEDSTPPEDSVVVGLWDPAILAVDWFWVPADEVDKLETKGSRATRGRPKRRSGGTK